MIFIVNLETTATHKYYYVHCLSVFFGMSVMEEIKQN